SREDSGDRMIHGTFAFGSSTPRILSHLYDTARDYCNGSRINAQVGRRSYTTPTFPTSRSKTTRTSTNVQMKRTDEVIQKPSDMVTSKSTRRILSTNYQPKEGSEEFMNSVKKKLEAQNDKVKSMKKVAAKEKQSKNKKIDGSKISVEKKFAKTDLPEALKKSSSISAKEPKSARTLAEEKQLLIAANTVDNEARLLSTGLTSTEKIVAKKVEENNSTTKASEESETIKILREEESEGRKIDVNNQSKSTGYDNLTDTFSIISKTNHNETDAKSNFEHKNETEGEFSINSESKKHEPSSFTAPIAPTINSDTSLTKLSVSTADKTFSLRNDNSKLKNENSRENSVDEIKGGETKTSVSSGLECDKLPERRELIPENLHQPQGNNSAAFNMQSQHENGEHENNSQS
ncbi:unnamed protein product, partial [Cercopithifilaria johnstoni]